MAAARTEDLLRQLAPQVLGAVVRRYGHFDAAEDATQEALIAAATQWPEEGIPDNPKAWLIRVAARRLTDLLRSEQARTRREYVAVLSEPPPPPAAGSADDSLIVLFLCCHPALTPAAQIALTLRAVGGLTTGQIARAFLVSEETMARRITRAKERVRDSGMPFARPAGVERLAAVLHVLYLIFTEGYARTRADLADEAIRLTRMARRALPDDGEVAGLLALMLLTDARRAARTTDIGDLIPMAAQDRGRWNGAYIREGVALVTAALGHGPPGPYQLQAAIAALHDEAVSWADTDWPQIALLYELLMQTSAHNPVIKLNHAVAVGMARGPAAGLTLVDSLAVDRRIAADHRLLAVRAHLLEMAGQTNLARETYLAAARQATSLPQQRYLNSRAKAL
jgi:RNA polymerase sigma factor (sigma-70 family)